MYRDKNIAVIIPARNNGDTIIPAINALPEYVDRVYVIDDASSDNTTGLVCAYPGEKVKLTINDRCARTGACVISGYKKALQDGADIAAVITPDNRIPADQLKDLIDPVINEKADYAKGNRFRLGNKRLPGISFIQHTAINMITFFGRLALGNFRISDLTDKFTVISKKAMGTINLDRIYARTGYTIDLLSEIQNSGFKIADLPRKTLHLQGEPISSQFDGHRYFFAVMPLLIKLFLFRLYKRCRSNGLCINTFLYFGSFALGAYGLAYWIISLYTKVFSEVNILLIILGIQLFISGVLLDMLESGEKHGP